MLFSYANGAVLERLKLLTETFFGRATLSLQCLTDYSRENTPAAHSVGEEMSRALCTSPMAKINKQCRECLVILWD